MGLVQEQRWVPTPTEGLLPGQKLVQKLTNDKGAPITWGYRFGSEVCSLSLGGCACECECVSEWSVCVCVEGSVCVNVSVSGNVNVNECAPVLKCERVTIVVCACVAWECQ